MLAVEAEEVDRPPLLDDLLKLGSRGIDRSRRRANALAGVHFLLQRTRVRREPAEIITRNCRLDV